MVGNVYVNLDEGLQNHFFEYDFGQNGIAYRGYKINHLEDVYLMNGKKILKETYLEVETLNTYLNDPAALTAENIFIERIKF